MKHGNVVDDFTGKFSSEQFPRCSVPIRRIHVQSSLMPLKSCAWGTHHRVWQGKWSWNVGMSINSSGFPPNFAICHPTGLIRNPLEQWITIWATKQLCEQTIINQLSFEEQMFSRLFLMVCPAVWSRETIKLSRFLSGLRNLFNLSPDLFSEGKFADVPAHHSLRCQWNGFLLF